MCLYQKNQFSNEYYVTRASYCCTRLKTILIFQNVPLSQKKSFMQLVFVLENKGMNYVQAHRYYIKSTFV